MGGEGTEARCLNASLLIYRWCKTFLNARELKHTHKNQLPSLLEVPVLFLTAFLLKAHSHPETDFSAAPLMPFATFLSLVLHQEYLTVSVHTLLSAFPCAFTLCLQCHLQPAHREGGCDYHQPVSTNCAMSQHWLHTLIFFIQVTAEFNSVQWRWCFWRGKDAIVQYIVQNISYFHVSIYKPDSDLSLKKFIHIQT